MGSAFRPQIISCSSELKGFLGTDNRFYLYSTERTFPVDVSNGTNQPEHRQYCRLRPELVRSFSHPLSPDAYQEICGGSSLLFLFSFF